MKKLLLVVGAVSMIACVIFLLLALLNLLGYYHVLDGSAELYNKLHRRMIACFASGAVFAAIGAVCIIVRAKI